MSQFLCTSLQTKNYLVRNKDMSSSHPIFWNQRKPLSDMRSSELFSWSYPPKNNYCAKVLAQISSQFTKFNYNYTNGTFVNPLKVQNNSSIDEMLSTQVIRKLSPNLNCGIRIETTPIDMSCALNDCVCDSSSMAERTAFSFDDRFYDIHSNNNSEDISVDSDSSNERTNKIQINDSKVLDSMQNDRQKKKKRKRRRRKKKISTNPTTEQSTKKCFLTECQNEFISFLFDNDSDYDINEELTDTDLSSNEEISICFEQINTELEQMCENLFVDYFFGHSNHTNSENKIQTNSGSDEIDFCPKFCSEISPSVEPKSGEEESEMTAINESIKRANENWNQFYSDVCVDERKAVKVNFNSDKPSVRVLHVWDFAHRRARCGQWEQLARDRQRFAEKCRRFDLQIGYIFGSEHRQRQRDYRLKYNTIESEIDI